jgi:aspartyl-tRNA(Asn)/glutamyl-tRNA(Gln) amidotransferase subunit B
MTRTYYTTIGLEIHAELATQSKMFCSCVNAPFESEPNTTICPVCTAQPGALPVVNMEAVKKVIQVGLALGGNIADFTEFDRKNYFYPDIPKGYQISQYKYPIVTGGSLAGVAITRVHLEEDTGTSMHEGSTTLVDFNRAGVALMELVTEPVIHDAETAMNFGRELQLLLQRLGISHANMERGEMRVEVNVSISPDPGVFGTKVEVKNINSFSAAGKAIEFEVARMKALHEAGQADMIVQETRGWDDVTSSTISQRSKENAQDYRYFPEPNIPKFHLHTMFDLEQLRQELPETPAEFRLRMKTDYGIKDADSEFFLTNPELATLFENTVTITGTADDMPQKVSNYTISDLAGLAGEFGITRIMQSVGPDGLAELVTMIGRGELSSRAAKDTLRIMVESGGNPATIANERGWIQQNDESALLAIVDQVITDFPQVVEEFKGGKDPSIMFLVGQAMKVSKGAGNPAKFQEILRNRLQ